MVHLRIRLPKQKTWVGSLVWELRFHLPQGNQTHAPQLLSPHTTTPEACTLASTLCSKRSHCSEKPRHRNEEQFLLTTTRESWRTAMKTQCSQK